LLFQCGVDVAKMGSLVLTGDRWLATSGSFCLGDLIPLVTVRRGKRWRRASFFFSFYFFLSSLHFFFIFIVYFCVLKIFKKNKKKIYYQKVIRAILIEPMKSQQLVVHLFFLEKSLDT
jgi:hypothetical protein